MKIKLLSLIISFGVLIFGKTSAADDSDFLGRLSGELAAPRFQVIVNNHLAETVNVAVQPKNYNSLWDGKCSNDVYSTESKAICKEIPGLFNGIPALFPLVDASKNSDHEIFYIQGFMASWEVRPFDGNIIIKSTDGKILADVSYALKPHRPSGWTKLRSYLDIFSTEGQWIYDMWDPFTIVSHDNFKVNVKLSESYPTGHSWCWALENEYYAQDPYGSYYHQYNVRNRIDKMNLSQMPCSAILMINLSEITGG